MGQKTARRARKVECVDGVVERIESGKDEAERKTIGNLTLTSEEGNEDILYPVTIAFLSAYTALFLCILSTIKEVNRDASFVAECSKIFSMRNGMKLEGATPKLHQILF
jgi:hypothetical protein